MILHDFYTVFAIITGVDFIGVLAFTNERHPDEIKVLKILEIAAAMRWLLLFLLRRYVISLPTDTCDKRIPLIP